MITERFDRDTLETEIDLGGVESVRDYFANQTHAHALSTILLHSVILFLSKEIIEKGILPCIVYKLMI